RQYTGVCVLAWMCSGIDAVVDFYHANLPTTLGGLLALHRLNQSSERRVLLVGDAVQKLEKLRDSPFRRRGMVLKPLPFEPRSLAAWRAAMALAQLDSLPAGFTASRRRSLGGETLAAVLNETTGLSLAYNPHHLAEQIRDLEDEWCQEDRDLGMYQG